MMAVLLDTWVLALIVLVMVGLALTTLFLLIQVVTLRTRYERFRQETALMFSDTHATMQDINVRLSAAGYPPGRIVPSDPLSHPARTAAFIDTTSRTRP